MGMLSANVLHVCAVNFMGRFGKTIFYMELHLQIKSGKIHVDSQDIFASVRILVIFILGF